MVSFVFVVPNFSLIFLLIVVTTLVSCTSGTVVFAPTPLPPDLSSLSYDHPSGAFSVVLPRNWSIYTQNTTEVASASFAAPQDDEPSLSFAAVNLGRDLDASALGDVINQYQTAVRPDIDRYTEQDRQAMGDGSWRLTGLRTVMGGRTQQVNTFIERSGSFVGVVEVIVPDDGAEMEALQAIINTFTIHSEAPLQTSDLTVLSSTTRNRLEILHVATWTTPAGVFFITGEVANYGAATLTDIPVRAVLYTADGLGVAEAVDTVMGYGIPPGGFAPFSLRFGQGQPALTSRYELILGNETWQPDESAQIYGQDELTWTDESTITDQGQLLITGSITNISGQTIRGLRAVVTVFDEAQNVIAAGFTDLTSPQLAPNDSADFQIAVPEYGGSAAQYIVNVQGRP
jgi:hypothetical protein